MRVFTLGGKTNLYPEERNCAAEVFFGGEVDVNLCVCLENMASQHPPREKKR